MPRYVSIHQGILDDGDYLALSHEAQRCWWQTRLDPRLGISGLGRFPWPVLRRCWDLDEEPARDVLGQLTRKWIRYDEPRELLWFVDTFRHEGHAIPTVRKAVSKEVKNSPASELLVEWWEVYRSKFPESEAAHADLTAFFATLSIGSRHGIDRVSIGTSRALRSAPLRSVHPEGDLSKPLEGKATAARSRKTAGSRKRARPTKARTDTADAPHPKRLADDPPSGTGESPKAEAIDSSPEAIAAATEYQRELVRKAPDAEARTPVLEMRPIGRYESGAPVFHHGDRGAVKAALVRIGGTALAGQVVVQVENGMARRRREELAESVERRQPDEEGAALAAMIRELQVEGPTLSAPPGPRKTILRGFRQLFGARESKALAAEIEEAT